MFGNGRCGVATLVDFYGCRGAKKHSKRALLMPLCEISHDKMPSRRPQCGEVASLQYKYMTTLCTLVPHHIQLVPFYNFHPCSSNIQSPPPCCNTSIWTNTASCSSVQCWYHSPLHWGTGRLQPLTDLIWFCQMCSLGPAETRPAARLLPYLCSSCLSQWIRDGECGRPAWE